MAHQHIAVPIKELSKPIASLSALMVEMILFILPVSMVRLNASLLWQAPISSASNFNALNPSSIASWAFSAKGSGSSLSPELQSA